MLRLLLDAFLRTSSMVRTVSSIRGPLVSSMSNGTPSAASGVRMSLCSDGRLKHCQMPGWTPSKGAKGTL